MTVQSPLVQKQKGEKGHIGLLLRTDKTSRRTEKLLAAMETHNKTTRVTFSKLREERRGGVERKRRERVKREREMEAETERGERGESAPL